MAKGSLYNFLHKQNGVFKLPSLIKVAIDVSKGMNYLHQNNIIHRDLKTANLLMDENEVRAFPELAYTCLYSSMFTWILNSRTVLFLTIIFIFLFKNFLAMHVVAHCLGLVFILVVSDVLICIFGIFFSKDLLVLKSTPFFHRLLKLLILGLPEYRLNLG